jgi:hypothetical protein
MYSHCKTHTFTVGISKYFEPNREPNIITKYCRSNSATVEISICKPHMSTVGTTKYFEPN